MGWTTTSGCERTSKGVFTIREYLDHEFASDHPDFPRHEVLDSSLYGRSEYYAAIRSTDRETGKTVTFALIALVSYKPSDPDGHTLGWKEMAEAAGPYVCRCPGAFSPSSIRRSTRTPPTGADASARSGAATHGCAARSDPAR